MLDRIPCMVWTHDQHGNLDYVNARWTAYTGLGRLAASRPDVWKRLVAIEDLERFQLELEGSLESGRPLATEVRLRQSDDPGAFRLHAVRLDPLPAEESEIGSWLGTATDIEDRERAEVAEHALERTGAEFERERARFTVVQQALMPPNLPVVAGLSFDAVYEPGMSDDKVGGDWYDAFRLLDGRVLLTIGDVSGSGLRAAVIMGVVRQIMRGIGQLHAEPALMLDAADRALRQEYPDALVTAWVGILDLVGHRLTYASAGHPPPLLLDMDGAMRELDHRTLPIGLRQGREGHASTIELKHGSMIVMYTDGLIEASHNIVDGLRRLHDTAIRMSRRRVAHPAALLRRLLLADSGSQDDVAILVVTTNFDESEKHLSRSSFDSFDSFSARLARRAFTETLSPHDFSDSDAANAELVFGELCGNVVRHAPGRIDVVVDRSGVQSVLHVLDKGVGFRHLSRLPADLFAEAGRGLFLVTSMTTEFTVSGRVGGGSHARAVLVGRYPVSLFPKQTLAVETDQVAATF
jgi:PAS domain S-box-containing protein